MKYALCIETLAATRRTGYNAVEIWSADGERLPILRDEVKNGPEAAIERHFNDIAYFQAADAPSRAQSGTGVLHYPRILTRLEERGFNGYFSWEFFPQGDALQAVAAARAVQPQLVF